MLLADFRSSNKSKFEKLSALLKKGYGISVAEGASRNSLTALKRLLERKISVHKLDGATLKTSSDLMEKTLMLECVGVLLQEFVLTSGDFVVTEEYTEIVSEMSQFIEKAVRLGDSFGVAVESAMRMYRSGKFRYPDDAVEHAASTAANEALGTQPMMAEPEVSMMEPEIMEPEVSMMEPEIMEPDIMEPEIMEPEIMDVGHMANSLGDIPDADMNYDMGAEDEYPMIEDVWSKFIK